MRNSQRAALVVVLVILACCQGGCARTGSNLASSNDATWTTREISEYQIAFRHPPDAALNEVAGLPGWITVDGRKVAPFALGMRPKYSRFVLGGVFYNFKIRFIMITEAAELETFHARRYGWTETPTIDLHPFDYQRDKDALLTAVERLYLASPLEWQQDVRPTSVAGSDGAWISGWDNRMKESKFFHEIVAVPLATNKILLVQAGYSKVTSSAKLQAEREIFANVVKSIQLLE